MRAGDDIVLLGFEECRPAAERVAACAGAAFAPVSVHRFPDGESLVRVPPALPPRVAIYRTLDHPNDKLVELMLCAGACRDAGAASLTLVAPYLCYMRQDISFTPGEAVSQRLVGAWLGSLFDSVITVDPHLHRIDDLATVLPSTRAATLTAAPLIGEFLAARAPSALVVGPDAESAQWAERVALAADLPWSVARKTRHSDRDVDVELPTDAVIAGAEVVLVDDVASTGHTLAQAARALLAHGASRVSCVVTHPLFCDDAMTTLREAGIDDIWSTDSIAHPSNVVALDGLLAAALVSPAADAHG